jgi:hypothetical protein
MSQLYFKTDGFSTFFWRISDIDKRENHALSYIGRHVNGALRRGEEDGGTKKHGK